MAEADLGGQLEKMRREWDARARENARFYVDTARRDWTDAEFFRSGEGTVSEEILTDMINICQGKDPKRMRVLEIGCGAGRVTRALAQVFGEVYGVDISGEMVRQAQQALADLSHVHIFHNNGKDLDVLGSLKFDFAFSSIVFQHIPSREVIESYMRAVRRRLRPGCLFKFQVQGGVGLDNPPDDTWLGVTFSEQEARDMALRCDFEMRYSYGGGTQYFWLWFFLPKLLSPAWRQHREYRLRMAYRRWRGRISGILHRQ
ncbi:MAG TPA: class I SAM-dependent methyltransferase [Bryobacteraceae bacterium]|jgi:SAM-dependent methyltransferase|nr:class I SAM-dependent methyltransferase [Bryobacteraceae bacterium]